MKKKRVLITGGCGFIGISIIQRLRDDFTDWQICVLDNFSTGTVNDLNRVCDCHQTTPDNLEFGEKVSLVEGDIRDYKTVLSCSKNIDCIIHLAANTGVGPSVEDPRLDMECNIIGTFNMLEAARHSNVGKFIFASSGAPAGEVTPPIHEEMPAHPVSPYGASKLAGEGYCSAYHKTYGIDTICLRFGNVYGPGSINKHSVVAKFVRQAFTENPCIIYGDGNQTRDFIYIEDLVSAIALCMEKSIGGEVFQIATGKEHTVGEVALIISEALAEHDIKMEIKNDSPRLGDVKRNYSDITKAKKILGWNCETSLSKGIRDTVDYFIETFKC